MVRILPSLALLGCGTRESSGPPPEPAAPSSAAGEAPLVQAQALRTWHGKPPLKSHYFDVQLRNPAAEPRWLVLPTTFPYEGRDEPRPGGEECEIQWWEPEGPPRAVLAHGVCAHFWAVRLPAGGSASVRSLPIASWWDEVPPSVELRVLVARAISVGELALEQTFPGDAATESGAVIALPQTLDDYARRPMWHPEGERLTPVVIDVESASSLTVPLPSGG